VRRADARLHFPERVIARQAVQPTPVELQLIKVVAEGIEPLNRLSQISILQALASSPEALSAQLDNMARNGTVRADFAAEVRAVIRNMPMSAKLHGLATVVAKLRTERPDDWRVVVFTERQFTQAAIQIYLESQGIKVGLINALTGQTNAETIAAFRKDKPEINVIISTRAGSEGVNLQAANVLVNYDLPWNPMIVEQRIGRVQRLASKYQNVFIYNILLKGTFEEYIVGRLLEKLQMASQAIGDIESILQASGMADGEEGGAESFEHEIHRLVMASLKGKDVEAELRQKEESVQQAKLILAQEQKNIDDLLGAMDDVRGPRSPHLPPAPRSMDAKTFTLTALGALGAQLHLIGRERYSCFWDGRRSVVQVSDEPIEVERGTVLYAPGSTAFDRVVGRITQSAWHRVEDLDVDVRAGTNSLAENWVKGFGGDLRSVETKSVDRRFTGSGLVQVRATVAHDSYERLVDVPIDGRARSLGGSGLQPLPDIVEDPRALGIDADLVVQEAARDPAISEFSRFYMERRAEEVAAAGDDSRKRKKLEDDFTPRLEMTLAGLDGEVDRELTAEVVFTLDGAETYNAKLRLRPRDDRVLEAPPLKSCALTGREVPNCCLENSAVSGKPAIKHLLVPSEETRRLGFPDEIVVCALSGKRVLSDEVEKSAMTERWVTRGLLKASAVSRRFAEPEYFVRCSFTNAEVLQDEVLVSQISGKTFRRDQDSRSVVSGKMGHRSEFLSCGLTQQPLLPDEAERCEVTGKLVVPGSLETCSVSGRRVLPSELETCSVTGRRALKQFLVPSSLSGARLLETAAVRSAAGRFCTPSEAQVCLWSGQSIHPQDLRTCALTGIPLSQVSTADGPPFRLRPLIEMLHGVSHPADRRDEWKTIEGQLAKEVGGRCRVEAAQISPDGLLLAVCAEQRTLLGFRVRHVGGLFSLSKRAFLGRITVGRRSNQSWVENP
jgi:hypothetical protein